MNPTGISSLPFRSTPSLLASSIPIWQPEMLKKTKQTHQSKRCYFSPALRNTTRNHRKERLKALPRAAAAADWAPASPQSLSRGQPNNLRRGQQPVLGPAKWSGLVCTATEERGCRNPELPHTQNYRFWTRKQNPNTENPQTKTHTTFKNWHCTAKCKRKSTSSHWNPETEVKCLKHTKKNLL